MNQLADALPHRISAVINLDGIPNERGFSQKIDRTDIDALNQELSGYLDHRRKASNLLANQTLWQGWRSEGRQRTRDSLLSGSDI